MEQVTLPEGEERRLLEALLTKTGTPRKSVTVAAAAKLISGSPLSKNASDLETALVRLVGRGLLESHSKGKQRAYQVTSAVARALKPPAPTRRTRPRAATVEDLQALEVRLDQKLDQIAQLLAPQAQTKPGANGKRAMERDFHVDLKIADDPRRPDAPEGIQVPGRGLVYYALSK